MKNKRIIFSWVCLIGWMTLIFYMSHQPGDVSSKQSELVIKIFSFLGINLNNTLGELATFIVRKTAHFGEYFVLYFFAFNVIKNYSSNSKAMMYSLLLVFLYACSDEIHQYFIPGRAMAIKDVMIDSFGGTIAFILNKIYINTKEIKNKNIYICE